MSSDARRLVVRGAPDRRFPQASQIVATTKTQDRDGQRSPAPKWVRGGKLVRSRPELLSKRTRAHDRRHWLAICRHGNKPRRWQYRRSLRSRSWPHIIPRLSAVQGFCQSVMGVLLHPLGALLWWRFSGMLWYGSSSGGPPSGKAGPLRRGRSLRQHNWSDRSGEKVNSAYHHAR